MALRFHVLQQFVIDNDIRSYCVYEEYAYDVFINNGASK